MKPFEHFLEQMKEAARLVQRHDPLAANEVIQDALKAAGLMPAHTPSAAARSAAHPTMVDLNPAPARTRRPRAPATAPRQHDIPQHDASAPGEFVAGTFSAATGTRRYKLYVPARAASGPRPLIVMLHGCTQNPDDFAAGTAMNALAERHGCLVLYPEQPRDANPSQCWNWFEAAHQARDAGEPALLAGMTRDVVATWQADPQKIYVAGLSAGGAMAAILGQAYPDLYAAVGVHSGLPAGCARDLITGLAAMKKAPAKRARGAGRPDRQVPVIVFHGDRDATVHPGNGDAVLHQFLQAVPSEGLQTESKHGASGGGRGYTRTVVSEDDRALAEYWELHGAGHSWSGGSAAGTYTDPAGPDASAEMLRFFLQTSN